MSVRIGTLGFLARGLRFASIAAVACGAADAASAQFAITRFTIDGGGAMGGTGGTFAISGTIGQPDAGRLAGSNFVLNGGFWFGGGGTVSVGDTPGQGPDSPIVFRVYPASQNPVHTQKA